VIGGRLVQERFRAMGTDCVVAVTARRSDEPRARRAFAAGRREVDACERVLSRFRADSDLSRLNRARGRWTPVDERLIVALKAALRVREETGGKFDPTILPALAAAGYDRSFEQLDGRPPTSAPNWSPAAIVELDSAASRARVEAGAAVDLGGLGKGFAASRALQAMREAWLELPGALVDLGGDIAVWGATPEGGPWRLAVADPRAPERDLATIAIEEGAVATSGSDQRRFGPNRELHHLIDPATGVPAASGPLAATVVGWEGAEVEAYATALAITPTREAADWLRARPYLSALLVPATGIPVVIGDLPLLDKPLPAEVIA
jgi:thiamine biosynthesis lipoprotein